MSISSPGGTTYGGDGRTSFALPELRGRAPMHVDDDQPQGQKSGSEMVSLSTAEMPSHTHTTHATTADATSTTPTGNLLGQALGLYRTHDGASTVAMRAGTLATTGGGQGHNNMQPYLAVNFCIALQGLFPSRN